MPWSLQRPAVGSGPKQRVKKCPARPLGNEGETVAHAVTIQSNREWTRMNAKTAWIKSEHGKRIPLVPFSVSSVFFCFPDKRQRRERRSWGIEPATFLALKFLSLWGGSVLVGQHDGLGKRLANSETACAESRDRQNLSSTISGTSAEYLLN